MMKTIHIIKAFETSIGKVLIVENSDIFNVGDRVEDDHGHQYVVKGIKFPTIPGDSNNVGLIV